jgi:hypothetical protein
VSTARGGWKRRSAGTSLVRDFRLLWLGDTVSQFGIQVSMLALPLVAVIYLKTGPQAVGAWSRWSSPRSSWSACRLGRSVTGGAAGR